MEQAKQECGPAEAQSDLESLFSEGDQIDDGEGDSLFGGDSDDAASPFMEDPTPSSRRPPPSPERGFALTLPPEPESPWQAPPSPAAPLLTLPPPCTEAAEAPATEAHDVSTLSELGQFQPSAELPPAELAVQQLAAVLEFDRQPEHQHQGLAIDSPQAGPAPSHDAQECHGNAVQAQQVMAVSEGCRPRLPRPAPGTLPSRPPSRVDLGFRDVQVFMPFIQHRES